MDYFNIKCNISGLPINRGDKVVGILISHENGFCGKGKNDEIDSNFYPISFAIHGKYNGQGKIGDIFTTWNWLFIKDELKLTLDEDGSLDLSETKYSISLTLESVWDELTGDAYRDAYKEVKEQSHLLDKNYWIYVFKSYDHMPFRCIFSISGTYMNFYFNRGTCSSDILNAFEKEHAEFMVVYYFMWWTGIKYDFPRIIPRETTLSLFKIITDLQNKFQPHYEEN